MRLLIVSDVADTGFGRVGKELGRRLLAMGWDVRILGLNYRGIDGEIAAVAARGGGAEALRARLEELLTDPLTERMVPAGSDLGTSLLPHAIRGTIRVWNGWKPERVILIRDPRAVIDMLIRDTGACKEVPTFNYVPIEGHNLPPLWRAVWEHVMPVAMSGFGQAELQALLGHEVPLVPHGVSEGFHPLTSTAPGVWHGETVTSRDGAKRALGWEGRTVLLRADRFTERKNYGVLFRALDPVLAAHPDALLAIHASPLDEGGDMNELLSRMTGAQAVGHAWRHPQVQFLRLHDTFTGLSDVELNTLYNAADLYVSPTMAEGFGLTLAESLACGVPVVSTAYSAIPEVVGPGGILVPPAYHFTNVYAHEWALVDEAQFTAAVERLMSRPALRREMGEAGRRHVAQFTWAAAAAAFDTLMASPVAVAA